MARLSDIIENFIKEGYTNNIYENAFDFLIERYIYATENKKKGIIMLESRGKVDDRKLLNHLVILLMIHRYIVFLSLKT